MTPAQKEAYEKMNPEERFIFERMSSRKWRLSNLYWVEDENGKKVKFRPNWAQQLFFACMWYLNVVLKVRQIGISTWVGILQLDRSIHEPNTTCGIVDKSIDDAKKKLLKIKFAYDHLDDPDDPNTAELGALIKQAVAIKTSNKTELEFTNGSKIWAGASLRGGTVNFLHITELGPIAFKEPKRAAEIASGSFNTVHQGNIIVIESTHEGGRYGLFYEMVRAAQKTEGTVRSMLEWRLHFFPWWREPKYALPLVRELVINAEQARYFKKIEVMFTAKLTLEQKNWWITKSQTAQIDMARQFPGDVEEALQALTPGSIYGTQIAKLYAEGRIKDFKLEGYAPLFTAWDIGVSDFCCIWLLQMAGLDILCHGFVTYHGERPAFYAGKMIEWEREFERPIARHFVPHDAGHKLTMAGDKSWTDLLKEAGLKNVTVVPRTPDLWVGINHLRSILPRYYFHATRCEKEVTMPGTHTILPSGLSALSGYHTSVEAVGGRLVEAPVHDASSHGSDAMRTFAEAHARGMIAGLGPAADQKARGTIKVNMGLRQPSVIHGSATNKVRVNR